MNNKLEDVKRRRHMGGAGLDGRITLDYIEVLF
jgi:hypothetical protein